MAKAAKKKGGGKRGRPSNAEKAAKAAAAKGQQPAGSGASASAAPSAGNIPGIKLPTKGVVPQLVKQLESRAGDIREITSGMGELVSKAQENKHVDKFALKAVRDWKKKLTNQPKGAAISWNHFLAYAEEMRISELADEALGMDVDAEQDEGDEDDGDGGGEQQPDAPAEQPAGGKSPSLTVVPGANAPVPSAPDEADEKAA